MYSDAESDNDYRDDGRYSGSSSVRDRLPLRVLDGIIYRVKDSTLRGRYRVSSETDDTARNSEEDKRSDKDWLRALIERPDASWWQDWRRFRVQRVFREIQGFHKGDLDLSGRSSSVCQAAPALRGQLTKRAMQRYDAIQKRFTPFLKDMLTLTPHVFYEDVVREEWDFRSMAFVPVTVSVPNIRDARVWERFRIKWKITMHVQYHDLYDWYAETLQVLREHAKPKFQKLYISQLPPEILVIVFDHTDVEEGRLLSATCRYLREIGLNQIFSTRRVEMKCPVLELDKLVTSREPAEVDAQVLALMTASRDDCIRQAQFLLSRPDICRRVVKLHLDNGWTTRGLWGGTVFGDAIVRAASAELLRPLADQLASLLRALRLQEISVFNVAVDVQLAREISLQPLSHLEMRICSATPELQQHFLDTPLESTITRLSLHILGFGDDDEDADDTDDYTAWCLLALCPRLRLLHVVNYRREGVLPMPAPRFWPALAALNNLERVHIDGAHWDLTDLTDMYEHAASRGPLRLTHLKLDAAWGMPDALVMRLLRVLHAGAAPLAVLALDGVFPLSLELFDALAGLFPALEALTLIRRENERQHRAMFCRWDRPLYEYAARMRPLARLRHFAANFYWDAGALSPYAMRRLEPGFDATAWESGPDADYMRDGRLVALPFAAYCVALRSFAVFSSYARYECKIRRLPGGAFELYDEDPKGPPSTYPEWNPVYSATFPLPPPAV